MLQPVLRSAVPTRRCQPRVRVQAKAADQQPVLDAMSWLGGQIQALEQWAVPLGMLSCSSKCGMVTIGRHSLKPSSHTR